MLLRDIYESREIKLNENARRSGVLGVVEGVFFIPEKPSRNGRVYSERLWKRVLSELDVKRLLENRLMIGTVGHEDVDFDALIREQKVSHVVTDLWIGEDGKGYGRAEILDTPVGRILYTLLKNGSKMAVSSKGWGEYKGITSDNLYVVDEGSFVLERFDFVCDPGFLEAMPGLKKQYESLIMNKEDKKEVGEMNEMIDVLVKEKVSLQEKLNESLNRANELSEENKGLKEEKKKLEKEIKELKEKFEKSGKGVKENFVRISEWLGVDKEEEIVKEIELVGKLIEEKGDKLVRMGVDKGLLEGESLSEVLARVFVEMEKIIEGSEKRFKLRLRRMIEMRNKVNKLERLLMEARRKLAIVESLGGINKIVRVLEMSKGFTEKLLERKMEEETQKLSAKYGIEEREVKGLIEKVGLRKAEKLLRDTGKRVEESRGIEEIKRVEIKENVFDRPLAERLSERLIK